MALKPINYSSYREMTQKDQHFQEGVKKFKEGKARISGIQRKWVKTLVSKTAWNNYYREQKSSCPLKKTESGLTIGFVSAGIIPFGHAEIVEDEELRQLDEYRRAMNVLPFVLEDII